MSIKLGIMGPATFTNDAFFNFVINDFVMFKKLDFQKIIILTANGKGTYQLTRDFAEEQSYKYEIKTNNNNIAKESDYLIAFTSSKLVGISKSIGIFIGGELYKNSKLLTVWVD